MRSKLLKKFLNPKFSCARTKVKAGIQNVIAVWIDGIIKAEISTVSFGVISCDASNHGAIKLLPVLFRYCFIADTGQISIKTVILDIHDLKNETAGTVSKALDESTKKYSLERKVTAFLADNAAVNFGLIDSEKKTLSNEHAMYEAKLQRKISPLVCAAHILSNALSTAVNKVIPIDVENIIFKIHRHFSIYTVRTET